MRQSCGEFLQGGFNARLTGAGAESLRLPGKCLRAAETKYRPGVDESPELPPGVSSGTRTLPGIRDAGFHSFAITPSPFQEASGYFQFLPLVCLQSFEADTSSILFFCLFSLSSTGLK
jgi:hypothetical protein